MIVNAVFDIIRRLKEEGTTIILIAQNTPIALGVADDVRLMCGGWVLLSETADKVDVDRLHDLYFAREGQSA